jgi:outer membrane protein assembly factor BamB
MVLSALNAQTGAVKWTSSGNLYANQNWFVQPTIAERRLYWLDNSATPWALKTTTGATSWSTSDWGSYCSPNSGSTQPQIGNGVLFISTSCADLGENYVTTFALAASSGNVLWQDAEGTHPMSGALPMIVDGELYSDCYNVCAYTLSGGSTRRP